MFFEHLAAVPISREEIHELREQFPEICIGAPSHELCQRRRLDWPSCLRGWHFSRHARAAVDARGFDPHAVVEACANPEIRATAFDYGDGRYRCTRGDIVVIAVPQTSTIITVLLRSYEVWTNAEARETVGY